MAHRTDLDTADHGQVCCSQQRPPRGLLPRSWERLRRRPALHWALLLAGTALVAAAAGMTPRNEAPPGAGSPAITTAPVAGAEAAVEQAGRDLAGAVAAARALPEPDAAELLRIAAPLATHLDLPEISRRLLGGHWHAATVGQRAALQQALARHLVSRHGVRLRALDDWQLRPLAGRVRAGADGAERAVVPVLVSARGWPALRLHLHLRHSTAGWRLFDASLDGVGLIGLQRPAFAALAAGRGVDSLIAALGR
jgi:phospholipid transport system substrate-binding protein